MTPSVKAFLEKHHFLLKDEDFDRHVDSFVKQMEAGLTNNPASLKMIPSYIEDNDRIIEPGNVIVIDAGGTNLRLALVSVNKDKFTITYYEQYAMPGTNGKIQKQEFFETLVAYLKPIINESDTIGFCFSYPAQIQPDKDGLVLGFNKGVEIEGMEQVFLQKTLNEYLTSTGYKEKQIIVLNDTVATLLGGKVANLQAKYDTYIGFILGTGTNTCYFEENHKILKDAYLRNKNGRSIINLESGGYDGIFMSDFDETLQIHSLQPNTQIMEKMISGAYQGNLAEIILKYAAEEQLFTEKTARQMQYLNKIYAKDISDFLLNPGRTTGCLGNIRTFMDLEEQDVMYQLLIAITQRAAYLTAVNMKAILKKMNKGRHIACPVGVSAEGSTFYKAAFFREQLQVFIDRHLAHDGYYVQLLQVEQATIYGSAYAALS